MLYPSFRSKASDHAPAMIGDDGRWNQPLTIIVWGVAVPTLILIWVAYDLWAGGTMLLNRRTPIGGWGHWFSFEQYFYTAFGIVAFKACVAAGLVVYFVVGNHPEWGWHRDLILLAIVAVAVSCLLLAVGGVLL